MNYMEQIAKMLGVEMGEKYEVIFPDECNTCQATVIFTDEGVKTISTNVYDVYNFKSYVLTSLLTGAYGLKRKPWKPTYNDEYYSIGMGGIVEHGIWLNDFLDFAMYRLGNCYRTASEAEANRDKWVAFYKSDEVLEV